MALQIEVIPVGPFQANACIVIDDVARRAVIVDPGAEGDALAARVRQSGLTLDAIWVTHGHLDHVGGIAGVRRAFPTVPIWLHAADRPLYDGSPMQARAYGIPFEAPPAPTDAWVEGDTVSIGEHRFQVMHLPGHAPGHVALVGDDVVFVGDVIFAGSIGRTDLPFCDPRAMQHSLARIATWPPALALYPGHGETTTVGAEVQTNPFLQGLARPRGASTP
ncbi:MAG: MBL fold metallo-hydrolase [Gemmatimonadaceae bacterium]|nr:MBL fold metallo-hydrolase [Gemmatimonadaceae bacterium]